MEFVKITGNRYRIVGSNNKIISEAEKEKLEKKEEKEIKEAKPKKKVKNEKPTTDNIEQTEETA